MYKNKYIMEFINYAVDENYKFDYSIVSNINWVDIFEESKEHSLLAIVYYSISKLRLKKSIKKELLNQWKKYVFICSTREIHNIENIKKISNVFNENKLDYIMLKGVVIRNLYPKAEFRTMSDCDIIVKQTDLEVGENLLKYLGYAEHNDQHGAHKVFRRGKQIVEMHWTLINDDFFNGSKAFEDELWNNIREVNIGEGLAYALNHEYMIVHLIAHMAVHVVWCGFGIRQLLDLYLYSREYENEINWGKVFSILKKSSLKNFAITLYIAIEKLFNYRIAKENYDKVNSFNSIIDNETIEVFIEYIFNSGVFGQVDKLEGFTNTIINSKRNNEDNKLITHSDLLFPSVENLDDRYRYAKKNKILMPIAWTHHLINGVFHSKFSIKEKVNFLFNSVNKVKSKEEMLKNIGLS